MNWIISDIHGVYFTLISLLERIDKLDSNPHLIFVGDYADRGPHSHRVVEHMIVLQSERDVTCLRGNHDEVIDYILNDHYLGMGPKEWVPSPSDMDSVMLWWMTNGLSSTLESYGVTAHTREYGTYGGMGAKVKAIVEEFREKAPDSHKSFLRDLPLFWESDTHFACHAFMRPDEELPRSLRFMPSDRNEETLWTRFQHDFAEGGLLDSVKTNWDKIGVFGHTPVDTLSILSCPPEDVITDPIFHDQIRLIDTGAFHGGFLTAYCCEQDEWIYVRTDERDMKKEG